MQEKLEAAMGMSLCTLQIPMSNKSRIEFILLKCWSEFNFMPVNLQAQKLHHTYAFAD